MWSTYISGTVAPPWLQGTWASRWLEACATEKDIAQEQIAQSIKLRFPSYCHKDALLYIGYDRQIERQLDDTDNEYRNKLLRAFDTWRWAGTRVGVLNAMVALGYRSKYITQDPICGEYYHDPDDTVWIVDAYEWGTQTPDGDAPEPRWARFWLFVDFRKVFPTRPFSIELVRGMIRTVQRWKGTHCKGRIVFVRDGYIRGPHETRGPHRTRGGRIMGAYDC